MHLTKEQIADALTRRAQADHPAPALGGTLCIRELLREEIKQATAAGSDDYDRVNMAIFALGVVDPATGAPLLTPEEATALVEQAGATPEQRTSRWSAVRDTAQAILDLSEVGPEALKSRDPAADA